MDFQALVVVDSIESDREVQETAWSDALCSVPQIIVIMGESLVLASAPNASKVCFGQKHLGQTYPASLLGATLPACLFECNQVGQRAFLSAHTGMSRVSMHSREIIPIINDIVRTFGHPPTSTTERILATQLKRLNASSSICQKTSQDIMAKFESWREFTEGLQRAVVGRRSEIFIAANVKKEKIMGKNHEVEQAMICKERAETAAMRKQRTLQEAIEIEKARLQKVNAAIDKGVDLATSNPSALLATCIPGSAYLAAAVVGGTACAVGIASYRVREVKAEANRRQAILEKAEDDRRKLIQDMEKLQREQTSLEEITAILAHALDRLQVLQSNITQMLLFFTGINDFVEILVTSADQIEPLVSLETLEMKKSERDAYLRDMVLNLKSSLDIKLRFIAMHKISQAYADVSANNIMPGLSILDQMSIIELSLTEGDVESRSQRLRSYSTEAVASIRRVTEQRQRELQAGVGEVFEDGAKYLQMTPA